MYHLSLKMSILSRGLRLILPPPSLPLVHLRHQRNLQLNGVLHGFPQQNRRLLRLLRRAFQQQFVVHLQDQAALQPGLPQRPVDPDHGQLDDIRRRALDGGVHGGALAELADGGLGALQLRQVAPPAHQGLGVTPVRAFRRRLVHKALHARIGPEVLFNEGRGFLPADAGVPAQAEAADAVDQAEVHRLGPAAQLRRHPFRRHVEDLAGRAGVDILAFAEGVDQRRVPGEMRHQPQLDLAVVRVQQHPALPGQEGAADLPALLRAHGDILQVRLRGGDPPGGGGGLVKGGMHPALSVHQGQQALHIGAVQLHQLAVAQQGLDDLRRDGPQLLQHLHRGGIAAGGLLAVGQLQLLKEHLAQLLGAVQVEGMTRRRRSPGPAFRRSPRYTGRPDPAGSPCPR